MRKEEVEFVPSGIIACFIDNNEVSVNRISPRSLTIRVVDKIDYKANVLVSFYNFEENKFNNVVINEFIIEKEIKKEFCYYYTIVINNSEFEMYEKKSISDYNNYVLLKNSSIDNNFSKEMVNYPSDKDYDFYEYYEDQKKKWMNLINKIDLRLFEVAINIDNYDLYNSYLLNQFEDFKNNYLNKNYLNDKLINMQVSRIYIGNEYCHNLFPNEKLLFKLMDKAYEEKLKITICFTYLRECYVEDTRALIDKIYSWCLNKDLKIEIVINDYGFIELLNNKTDYFKICLGNLLNKRKKDPRYIYKNGYKENKDLMSKNSLNNWIVNKFYKNNNIDRYEYESCGYIIEIPEGNHSLHIPFYQTNTSQFCPLYARCTTGNRGSQKLVKKCPNYCRDYVFLYPKHLMMVGRYNSLFAFDKKIFNKDILKKYYEKGIDRIVLNFK